MPAAANLLERAAALTPVDDPGRPRLLLESGEAMLEAGDITSADGVLAGAIEEASSIGDRGLETTIQMARLDLHYTTDPESDKERVVEEVERALPILEELGAHDGLARAWRVLTHVHWTAGKNADAEAAARRTIEHARLAGDRLMETRFQGSLSSIALYGPTPVVDAIALCEDLLANGGGDRRVEGLSLRVLAQLEAMRGEFERARDLYRRSRAVLEEFGWNLLAVRTSIQSGQVELLAGDPVAAEAELRKDYEALERMGERNYISTVAAMLAEPLYRQERYEEAEELTRISENVAAPDDFTSQSLWRCVRGKVAARAGRFDEAESLVREAVRMSKESDEPDSQASVLMDLAEVLDLAGHPDEAIAVIKEALELFGAKGNVVSAERARGVLETLEGGLPAGETRAYRSPS